MDKLAMEEAGFRNCVSVPDGAPASVSKKDLPPQEMVGVVMMHFSIYCKSCIVHCYCYIS